MNREILEKLKLKRKEIARREGKKLFMIFHNAVLERTAEVLPKTKDNLANNKLLRSRAPKYLRSFALECFGNQRFPNLP